MDITTTQVWEVLGRVLNESENFEYRHDEDTQLVYLSYRHPNGTGHEFEMDYGAFADLIELIDFLVGDASELDEYDIDAPKN